jgi:hypothetical protein
VLWIGHLQWHIRTKGGLPSEPILQAFHNIEVKDAVLTWDGYPVPKVVDGKETYPNAKRPEWPNAEFIVGNPPFIGGKDIRARMGDAYVEALWKAHKEINESADFVMYWWDRAAELLTRKATVLKRFGLVTTNSISQVFQRRVIERHLTAKNPVSIVMAIPDHPWTKASPDAAAVRIAMTVADAGKSDGFLRDVIREDKLDTDAPTIELSEKRGTINSDLTIGSDITLAKPLLSNEGLCSRGMSLHGSGFIVTRDEAESLGLSRRKGLSQHIREYRNGRDLASRPRGVMVIDLFGLEADDVRKSFPEVYQHIATMVKPERDTNNRATYRDNWWVFGEPRRELRPALKGLKRYIATVETMRHRLFVFLSDDILPDNKLIAICTDDAFALGILSARIHVTWSTRAGGWLGMGNDSVYVKTDCFDPFPFPDANAIQKQRIRVIAEELDALRKRVLAEHGKLTLTGLYNVLEELRKGTAPDALDESDRAIFDAGQVLILKELHDKLDAAVADAYGWPTDLSDDAILANLVALNRERATEEAKGKVRWLRPDYQIPRFGSKKEKKQLDLDGMEEGVTAKAGKKAFPASEIEQTAAVMAALAASAAPLDAGAVARSFRQGGKAAAKVAAVLTALVRMGFVDTPDRGRTFVLRRAA